MILSVFPVVPIFPVIREFVFEIEEIFAEVPKILEAFKDNEKTFPATYKEVPEGLVVPIPKNEF